jgi:type I restriction enzyme S subunit
VYARFGGGRMKEWQGTELSKYLEIYSGFAFKSEDLNPVDVGFPIIKIAQIQNKQVLKNVEEYFPTEKFVSKLSKYNLKTKDTLIAMTGAGSVGKVGRMRIIDRNYLVNQRVAIVRSKLKELDGDYLYYFLTQEFIERGLYDLGLGAGQPNISPADIGRIQIFLPPLPTQRKIAAILSSYDDLIENNNRRISILEKMAEELYREWFVRLRFPGHENVKIVKGVPEGWEVKNSFEILNILGGGTPKTDVPSYWDGEIPFFTPKDSHDGYFTYTTEKTITEQGIQSCNSQLYPKKTIFITARGTVGNIVLAMRPMAMNQSCYALVPKNKKNEFYHFLALRDTVAVIKGTSNSGVFDNIITESFKQFGYFMPTDDLLLQFEKNIVVVFEEMEMLFKQNRVLSTTRDRLLSRLMSGKIDVENLDIEFPKSMKEEVSSDA